MLKNINILLAVLLRTCDITAWQSGNLVLNILTISKLIINEKV